MGETETQDERRLGAIRRGLLDWFGRNKRELPWRETRDAYRIWISEIILQQTRVKQGYDYYLRFVSRFPTVESLAKATEDEVLLLWQGLGYYSRARNIYKAARQIMERHGGVFPRRYEDVRRLAGIGDYTAAAICSFAYDDGYAVVDGNVYRVLARLFGVMEEIDTPQGKRVFQQLADRLLNREEPAQHNQAMMEFGALMCEAGTAGCRKTGCPLEAYCAAYQGNYEAFLPCKKEKQALRHRYFNYFIVEEGGKTYIQRREGKDIWRHLYEFPLVETEGKLLKIEGVRQVTLQHTLSHQQIHARFFVLQNIQDLPQAVDRSGLREIMLTELDRYAFSRLTLNGIQKLQK